MERRAVIGRLFFFLWRTGSKARGMAHANMQVIRLHVPLEDRRCSISLWCGLPEEEPEVVMQSRELISHPRDVCGVGRRDEARLSRDN